MIFNLGNALKYLWQNGLKDASQQLDDLRKAKWYIDRKIQRLETMNKEFLINLVLGVCWLAFGFTFLAIGIIGLLN